MSEGVLHKYPILIIDDYELFGCSLRKVFGTRGVDAHHLPVDDRVDLRVRVRQFRPGVAVPDLDLGQGWEEDWASGRELVEALCGAGWQVLVVSSSGSNTLGVSATVDPDATDSAPESRNFRGLLDVISAASASDASAPETEAETREWFTRQASSQARERELSRRLRRLTSREREVLDLLADGHRTTKIAEHLVVSIATVRTHIRSLLAKLEVSSQLEAAAMVRKQRDTIAVLSE